MLPCPNYGFVPRSTVRPLLSRLPFKRRNFSSCGVNNQWQALTWIAQSPHNVTPADLLPAYTHLRESSGKSSIVPILFASPEFTAWTDPTNPLLRQWITPLFNKIFSGDAPEIVHTVAAVVDRISTASRGNVNGNYNPSAAEGLSLLLADSSSISVSVAPSARVRRINSEEPAFFLKAQKSNDGTTPQSSYEIGLRLAQTVFRNGRERTLLGMQWIRDPSSNMYSLSDCQELSTCSVTCPAAEARCSIDVPLYPVTQRRRVVSSMGNILRQVSKSTTDGEGSDTGIPASTELEKELPRYVSELGIPHQRVAVWALVELSKKVLPTETHSKRIIEDLILAGSKIHRVVSGGGGWGKKQGLLSLDPETQFRDQHHTSLDVSLGELFQNQPASTSQAEIDAFHDIMEGKELEEDMASLSQVASPGDSIQFFVASESASSTGLESNATPTSATLSYSFGVEFPIEAELADSSLVESSRDITVIPGHFGAISESAISYSQEGFSSSSSEESKCGTKISVPGSRVELFVA